MQSGSLHTDDDKPIKNRKGALIMDSYEKIEQKMAMKKDFSGNSAWAKNTGSGYEVYSYSTLIFRNGVGGIFFDNRFYSMTTRRIQGIIARCYSLELSDFPTIKIGKRGGKHQYNTSALQPNGLGAKWIEGDYDDRQHYCNRNNDYNFHK